MALLEILQHRERAALVEVVMGRYLPTQALMFLAAAQVVQTLVAVAEAAGRTPPGRLLVVKE